MRCRRCNTKAIINMRQHKLALCKEHYPAWVVEQTGRFIEKYQMFSKDERLLVAVSGGKDSLSLWDILWQLGYQADGLYIGLGIDSGIAYSAESRRCAEKFALARGLRLHVVDMLEEYGETIPQMAERTDRGQSRPCAACGLAKRHVMNRIARDGGYQVLVTGHNLDDEAAVLFANTLNWIPGYLVRQGPVLEARPGMARKAKPLFRFYEREMAAYALVRGIEYIYEECPYSEGTKTIYYKGILNQLEEDRPGAKLNFFLSFLRAREGGLFASHNDQYGEGEETGASGEALHLCPTCGQPTSSVGVCAFCKMVAVK